MKCALVLGGGGLVGVAWESGLCRGLFESGFDLRTVDAIVGTSAGAIIGSQLAAGQWPPGPGAARPAGAEGANVDSSKIDMQALGAAFTRWSKIERTTIDDVKGIGAIARTLYRDAEEGWVRGISAYLPEGDWPKTKLIVMAVDTLTGERKSFDAQSGVQLGRVVAASAAVPGIFSSVSIGDALYMDGQVHSSTHADVLVPLRPERVIIVMPTNTHTAPGIGAHAEREVADEIEQLRAVGCEVHLITPSAADTERMGKNLMDAKRQTDAYAVGLETGRAFASKLA